jgi:2-oxoglutarate ferredoxin oxidoreductase subunit alpha
MIKEINIKLGGAAGAGVKVTGQILSKALTRLGLSTYSYREYPSLLRGGHTTYQTLAVSEGEAYAQKKKVDILFAFNKETYKLHEDEIIKDTLVIYDDSAFDISSSKKGVILGLPLTELAEKAGDKIAANSVALGACFALLGFKNINSLQSTLEKRFESKGDEIIQVNHKAAKNGYQYIKSEHQDKIIDFHLPTTKEQRIVLTGNDACALGAISAGLKFYCAYPMTPATSILHYIASEAEKYDIVVKQPEDEIAAINMSIGASFAGVRAMTATSGGGFCLMTEGLGLAGTAETPLVIVESMRTGPASGLPTWSGQGDLRFAIHASQDEFPRFVFTPGDVEETFAMTRTAFELAEKYQTPVIILLDKNLSESDFSCIPFKNKFTNKRYSIVNDIPEDYKRYKLTENGISPRPFLGQEKCNHLANSYDHDQYGYATEDSEERTAMMDKRKRKFAEMKKEIPELKTFGKENKEVGIISWGSTKGPVLEALKTTDAKYLHLNWVWPFPSAQVKDFIESVDRCICVEGNSEAQLAGLIKEYTGKEVESLLRYDGRPVYPHQIIDKINEK